MLSSELSQAVAWTTIIANIVTTLGIVGLFGAFFSFLKNRPTQKNILCEVQTILPCIEGPDEKRFRLDLHISNLTDESFSITNISCVLNGKAFPVYRIARPNGLSVCSEAIDVIIGAHMSATILGLYVDAKNDTEVTSASLLLITTMGELKYVLDPLDFGNLS